MRYVDFEAGGKVYNLRYDFNAIADLEQKSGSGIVRLFSDEKLGFSTIRALLWAGLKSATPNITIEEAGSVIGQYVNDGNSVEELSGYITKALNESGLFGKVGGQENETPFPEEASPKKSKSSKK